MKIEADGEEKIAVTLTNRDMQDFDITYEEMDYGNIETRRVIWTILDEAKRVLGKPINIDNRLLVQVSPLDGGGCIMHFTLLEEGCAPTRKRLIMKKEAEPLIFKADDDNSFLDCLPVFKKLAEYIGSAEFFTCNNQYFALVTPKISHTDKLIFALSEFGEISVAEKTDSAHIKESYFPISVF